MKGARIRFIGKVVRVEAEKELATIVVDKRFVLGLRAIRGFSHLIILYWIHMRDTRSHRSTLEVVPKRHPGAPMVGVFATRSPSRPNPIGLCVTRLISVRGATLVVEGLDAFEGSPIVDIKPYLPRGDRIKRAKVPAWTKRGPRT